MKKSAAKEIFDFNDPAQARAFMRRLRLTDGTPDGRQIHFVTVSFANTDPTELNVGKCDNEQIMRVATMVWDMVCKMKPTGWFMVEELVH